MASQPVRFVTKQDYLENRAVHVVWELTLACDLRCQHCGSRAGSRRPEELTTEECLRLIDQLPGVGTREVTLIGGEAYLRRDWLDIVRAIRAKGIGCSLQSGGLHLTPRRLREAADAGLLGVGISIDGLAELHDALRGVPGSFDAAITALRHVPELNMASSVNTQITAPILPQLRDLASMLMDLGVKNWQVQLTVPMGRAADNHHLLLQPYQLIDLMPLLADLFRIGVTRGLLLQPGNNIGYFGPYEDMWRGFGVENVHWVGCSAGMTGFGVEADGTIKGCPSLGTADYAAGSIRDWSLEYLLLRSRGLVDQSARSPESLWGYCSTCYYASVCRGGCTWMASSLFGRPGNNPYCHHRVLALASEGRRERVVFAKPAPGTPFDSGEFDLVVEALDGSGAGSGACRTSAPPIGTDSTLAGRPERETAPALPIQMDPCRSCHRHVLPGGDLCPHCHEPLQQSQDAWDRWLAEAKRAAATLTDRIGAPAQD